MARRAAKEEDQVDAAQRGGVYSQTVQICAGDPQKLKWVMASSADHICRPCNHTTVIDIHKISAH